MSIKRASLGLALQVDRQATRHHCLVLQTLETKKIVFSDFAAKKERKRKENETTSFDRRKLCSTAG
jgi:hypothetical protein